MEVKEGERRDAWGRQGRWKKEADHKEGAGAMTMNLGDGGQRQWYKMLEAKLGDGLETGSRADTTAVNSAIPCNTFSSHHTASCAQRAAQNCGYFKLCC